MAQGTGMPPMTHPSAPLAVATTQAEQQRSPVPNRPALAKGGGKVKRLRIDKTQVMNRHSIKKNPRWRWANEEIISNLLMSSFKEKPQP
jgi:hypothetical protein